MSRGGRPSVIMVGPSLDSKGGMATVASGYIAAGIGDVCDFEYIETTRPGNAVVKALVGLAAYARFLKGLPGCDVVHLHIGAGVSPERKFVFAKAAKRAGKVVVLHEHRAILAELYREGRRRFVERNGELYGLADVAVVLSEEWGEFFAENVCEASKVRVLHNAVAVPAEPCAPEAQRDVLFLGRLGERKSPDVLLRASGEALARFPETRLLFGGDGPVGPYETLAADLGILDRCEFLGWVSGADREALFSRAAVYCLPSKSEGMPMSVLEAMARGIPVISTAVGGTPRLIEDGRDGLLMGVDDEGRLSELLVGLLSSPARRAEIGLAGRGKVEREFGIGAALDRLAALYEELVEEG